MTILSTSLYFYAIIKPGLLLSFTQCKVKKRGFVLVINQLQLPLQLPCFDFRPVSNRHSKNTVQLTLSFFTSICFPAHDEQLVHPRDNIHRVVMIHDYSEFLLHTDEFQSIIRTLSCFDDQLLLSLQHHFVEGSCGTSIAQSIRAMRVCHSPQASCRS